MGRLPPPGPGVPTLMHPDAPNATTIRERSTTKYGGSSALGPNADV